ncbi:transposase [Bacillaceae bacterium IKA-2]|nr:transposase [Bacillaceae bacterium IKA-2]
MGRGHRISFPNAMYHITNRGVRKMAVFFDDADRYKYLQILEETRARFPFLLHSYCLMDNHIHLQLQTLHDPISTIMKHLNLNYAKYFNKKHDLVGHLFQGRYGSELIDSVSYELDVSKYIHLNPVEAQMVKRAEDYRWSSYRAYISLEENPHVYTDNILSHFPNPSSYLYQMFVEIKNTSLQTSPISIKPFV